MPLQGFVANSTPTIKAAWLNLIDAFYVTLFQSATTAAAARTAIGVNLASGTFTATGTGFSSGGTATWKYTVNNGLVSVTGTAVTGTSNTTAFTITGFPAAIYPPAAESRVFGPLIVTDNNVYLYTGYGSLSDAGVMTLYSTAGGAGWTGSSTKALFACNFSYMI